METSVQVGGDVTESVVDAPPLMQYRKRLRTWAGHGTGARCNACGRLIQTHEIEYEIELPLSGEEKPQRFQAGSDARSLRFHFSCYRNWSGR